MPSNFSNSADTHSSNEPQITQALPKQLNAYVAEKFTGKLDIQMATGQQWTIYLNLGRLVWATGGDHPVRRWRRHLLRCCPNLNLSQIKLRQSEPIECWDYHILVLLVLRKVSQTEKIAQVIHGIAQEVFFDLNREITLASLHPSEQSPFTIDAHTGVRPSSRGILPQEAMLKVDELLEQARQAWQNWVAGGLTHCYPNAAPVLTDVEALEEKTPPHVYKNLVNLINGKRTLRDLAGLMNKDVLTLTQSLIPYFRQRLVDLSPIADLARPTFNLPPQSPKDKKRSQPLVACIEDDAGVQKQLEEIFKTAGYRFLPITDPVKALPLLLQHKPNFVFLDLVMPIANGYEICAQIRRIKEFEQLPIAILTSSDGLVDRVRAKMSGATTFLAKPIESQKVLETVRKVMVNSNQ
ncbi:response regulator [Spirulina sp. CS-785/01]|uniref:response regulator n=1 Tax=Spirulina sp. CS-785/01 TaxID=3021716 RepID=UPI00232BE061|nr:response regulator [Spirulina sp. CS-785/01]MDB9312038.1 response regulator [Spirulina sp. CS-785/01]